MSACNGGMKPSPTSPRHGAKNKNVIGPVLGIPYQYKFKTVKEIPGPDGK
jgi:hypothetical protein